MTDLSVIQIGGGALIALGIFGGVISFQEYRPGEERFWWQLPVGILCTGLFLLICTFLPR